MTTTGSSAADERVDADVEAKIAKYTERVWNTDSDITVVARECSSGKDRVSFQVFRPQASAGITRVKVVMRVT